MRVVAASQLIVHATTSCCCWAFTFVTVVLAVNAIAGADYSAFVIFIPQFIILGTLLCCVTCFICCTREFPDMGERAGFRGRGEKRPCMMRFSAILFKEDAHDACTKDVFFWRQFVVFVPAAVCISLRLMRNES